jgi:hypothetical protein
MTRQGILCGTRVSHSSLYLIVCEYEHDVHNEQKDRDRSEVEAHSRLTHESRKWTRVRRADLFPNSTLPTDLIHRVSSCPPPSPISSALMRPNDSVDHHIPQSTGPIRSLRGRTARRLYASAPTAAPPVHALDEFQPSQQFDSWNIPAFEDRHEYRYPSESMEARSLALAGCSHATTSSSALPRTSHFLVHDSDNDEMGNEDEDSLPINMDTSARTTWSVDLSLKEAQVQSEQLQARYRHVCKVYAALICPDTPQLTHDAFLERA